MKKFGLSKKERIKSKKEFDLVFGKGTVIISNSRNLKAIFYFYPSNIGGVKVAFAIHKKSGNAAWRNRVKRLLREIYRTNKHLINIPKNLNKSLLIILSLNKITQKKFPKICLDDFHNDVLELLAAIRQRLDFEEV